MPQSAIAKTYFKIQELAHMWGVSEVFIRREIWAGRLEGAKFGRSLRVSADEAGRYARDRAVKVDK